MRIYVGNLPFTATDEEVRELFEKYGEVDNAKVMLNRDTGRSKRFGFVEMPYEEEARDAIALLNKSDLDEFKIVVEKREDRGGYGGGNRGGGGYHGSGGGDDEWR